MAAALFYSIKKCALRGENNPQYAFPFSLSIKNVWYIVKLVVYWKK